MGVSGQQQSYFGHAGRRGVRLVYTGFAFVLALFHNSLWEKETGLGAALLVAIALIGFLIIVTATGRRVRAWPALLFIPPLTFALYSVLYRNSHVAWMTPIVAVLFGGVGAVLATLENPGRFPFAFSNIPLLRDLFLIFKRWGTLLRDLAPWKGLRSNEGKRVYKGIALALPLLIIFGALFADADRVFLEWVKRLIEVNLEDIWRAVRVVVLTLLTGGFLYAILSEDNALKGDVRNPARPDTIVVGVVLTLVNALFALFNFVQFRYLFGGARVLEVNGLTHADYARAGFGQLSVVLILAAIMILAIYRSFSREARSKTIDALQIVFTAQVGVIAASALRRMNLYEQEFGYTVLRLYVEWFIYFVFFVLVGTAVSILARLSFKRYWYAFLASGALAATIVGAVNVDAVIAKENIARFKAGQKLDIGYLIELSDKRSTGVIAPLVSLVEDEALRGKLTALEAKTIALFFEHFRDEAKKYDSFLEYHYGMRRASGLITDTHKEYLEKMSRVPDAAATKTPDILGEIRALHAPLCPALDGIEAKTLLGFRCAVHGAHVPRGYLIAANVGGDRIGKIYVIKEDVTKKPFYRIVATLTVGHTEPRSEEVLLADGRIAEIMHGRREVIFYRVVQKGAGFELNAFLERVSF